LQEEILRKASDASLFAWTSADFQRYRGILAKSPAEFSGLTTRFCSARALFRGDIHIRSEVLVMSGIVRIKKTGHEALLALIGPEQGDDDDGSCVGIRLRQWKGDWVRTKPQSLIELEQLPESYHVEIRIRRCVDLKISNGIEGDQPALSVSIQYHSTVRTGPALATDSSINMSTSARPKSSYFRHMSATHRPLSGYENSSTTTDAAWSAAGSTGGKSRARTRSPTPLTAVEASTCNLPGCRTGALCRPPLRGRDDIAPSAWVDTTEDSNNSEEEELYLLYSPISETPESGSYGRFAGVLSELTDFTLRQFERWVSQPPPTTKRGQQALPKQNSKRMKRACFEKYMTVDQNSGSEDETTIIVDLPRPIKGVLACPFYLLDPQKHLTCLTRAVTHEMIDIKRHLYNSHRQPYYCPTCRNIFTMASSRDDHIRDRSCLVNDVKPIPEGVTEEQMSQLAKRFKPWLSKEDQWYAVWKLVFAGKEPPSLPYLAGDLESVVCVVRDYWSRFGQAVVSDFLEIKGLRDYSIRDEERNLAVLYETVINEVIDKLVSIVKADDNAEVSAFKSVTKVLAVLRRLSWSASH
jgi:hypothetical protein